MLAACSSSLVALRAAVDDLQNGRIDYAIVAGSNAVLRPQTSFMQMKLNMLSPEASNRPHPTCSICNF